jgi:hypothetical protein
LSGSPLNIVILEAEWSDLLELLRVCKFHFSYQS